MMNSNDFEEIRNYPLKYEFFPDKLATEERLKLIYMQERLKAKRRAIFFRVAACVTVLFGCFKITYLLADTRIDTDTLACEYVLPDGSLITIHPHSQINYNALTWIFSRDVELRGAAEFSVVKTGKPFTVETSLLTVSVLGTIFKIAETNGVAEVSCSQGAILVESAVCEQQVNANEKIEVTKDSAIISKNDISDSVNEPESSDSTLPQVLIFESISLSKLSIEMENIFPLEFKALNSAKDILYTGPIFTDNLQQSLDLIKVSCSVSIKNSNNTIVFH
ncbi:MAG: FecR family protein [Bacteroidales bacterium]